MTKITWHHQFFNIFSSPCILVEITVGFSWTILQPRSFLTVASFLRRFSISISRISQTPKQSSTRLHVIISGSLPVKLPIKPLYRKINIFCELLRCVQEESMVMGSRCDAHNCRYPQTKSLEMFSQTIAKDEFVNYQLIILRWTSYPMTFSVLK